MKTAKKTIFMILALLFLMSATGIDQATYQLGKRLFNEERYEEAAAEFKKIISRYQDSSYYQISLYYTGLSYQFARQPARALTYFKELYRLADSESQKEMAFFGIGKSYFDQAKYANAINVMKQFLQYHPGSKKMDAVLFMMGQSYDYKGYPRQSRIWYNQLRQGFPNSPYTKYIPSTVTEKKMVKKTVKKTVPAESRQVNETVVDPHEQDWVELDEVQENILPQQSRSETPTQKDQVVEEPHEKVQKQVKKIVIQIEPEDKIIPVVGRVEGLILSEKKKIEIPVSKDTQSVVVQPQNLYRTNFQHIIQTNYQNVIQTNFLNMTNMTVMTQKVKVLDTDQLKIDNKRSQMELKQEEIDRLRHLLEIKARLLELKEEAIKQKAILLQKKNAVVVSDEE